MEGGVCSQGFASIHLAALHGRLSCLQYLVEQRQVPVSLPSREHCWTPLHLAVNRETSERAFRTVLYLIDRGADLEAYASFHSLEF